MRTPQFWAMQCIGLALFFGGGCASKPLCDVPTSAIPEGMVYIPAGVCDRGDSWGEGYGDERPVRAVSVRAFCMDRTEVSWELWEDVFKWALEHGYEFGANYEFHPEKNRRHPVCSLDWYDAVKWCNARSEKQGRQPVYCVDEELRGIYRRGTLDLTSAMVRWEANGFRLPTELEWEWAARGGLKGQHYPWRSEGPGYQHFIDGRRANYWESGDRWESGSNCGTSPVGYFGAEPSGAGRGGLNGYGLLDMAGNVSEWCWDWYLDTWYADPASAQDDTRGPAEGYGRVLRGGSWISSPKYCRVSARYISGPSFRCHCYGLRCVIRAASLAAVATRNPTRP